MKGSIGGLIAGIAVAGIAQAALAADLGYPAPDLFTPSPVSDWGGLYVGGQVAYSHANLNFGDGAAAVLAQLVSQPNPGSPQAAVATPFKAATAAGAYGAYIGYNTQWESVILGIEGNYNRTSIDPFALQTVQ